jgi:hypothetical protein
MDVERAAALVLLRDARGLQVVVEDFEQVARDVEGRSISRQARRDRLPAARGLRPVDVEPLDESTPKVPRQVGPEDDPVALSVLLARRVELDVRDRASSLTCETHTLANSPRLSPVRTSTLYMRARSRPIASSCSRTSPRLLSVRGGVAALGPQTRP